MVTIKLRNNATTAGAVASTYIPIVGEPLVALDSGEIRVGNGSSTWSNLPNPYSANVFLDLKKQPGVVGNGTTDDTTAINNAFNSAASLGIKVFARGSYGIAGTVNISNDCDLGQATFNWTGTGTGPVIKVGGLTSGVSLLNKRIVLPAVVNTKKTVNGWAQAGVVGTVGIHAQNMYNCRVSITNVQNFETGLKVWGEASGVSYTTFDILSLTNNKVNLLCDHNGTGWVNQNLFMNGRLFHFSNEGTTPQTGVKHIWLRRSGTTTGAPNNNTFLNTSVESPNTVEFCIDIEEGRYNQFINNRFEIVGGVGTVRWGAGAWYNRILGGFNSDSITQTWVSGALSNVIDSGSSLTRPMTVKGAVWENTSGATSPIHTFLRAGGIAASDDPATGYVGKITANLWSLKRNTDSFDRLQLDAQNGRVYLGNASAAPTLYFSANGTTGININGGNLYFATDNTNDIGLSGSVRPRYVRAATGLQTGAFATASRPTPSTAGIGTSIFDTTLGKPVWSNGTSWVDANGTVV